MAAPPAGAATALGGLLGALLPVDQVAVPHCKLLVPTWNQANAGESSAARARKRWTQFIAVQADLSKRNVLETGKLLEHG
jgi:hypothetical protein